MGRVQGLVAMLVLLFAAPARAGEVEVDRVLGAAALSFTDPAGAADDLRVVSTTEETVTVLGATVSAGRGCVPVPGGANCTLPAGAAGWEWLNIHTEGGDDRVVAETPQAVRVFAGAGNDTVTFGPGTGGYQFGEAGDDALSAAAGATLEGGPGDDHLTAGAAAGLSGGPGTDRLDGSPQADVLVDTDRGSRDVIACHGGADVIQADPADAREGCARPRLIDIAKVDYYWRVRFGPRLSVPTRMRVVEISQLHGVHAPFAECVGRPCHRARFDSPLDDIGAFRIVSGGRRVRIGKKMWRGVSPGAIVRAGLSFRFSDVEFTKSLEFRTRLRRVPTVRPRCTVTIPAYTGRTRTVPCT